MPSGDNRPPVALHPLQAGSIPGFRPQTVHCINPLTNFVREVFPRILRPYYDYC